MREYGQRIRRSIAFHIHHWETNLFVILVILKEENSQLDISIILFTKAIEPERSYM